MSLCPLPPYRTELPFVVAFATKMTPGFPATKPNVQPRPGMRMSIADVLTNKFPTDAHHVGYDQPKALRVNKEGLGEVDLCMQIVAHDYDDEIAHADEHPAREEWIKETRPKIERLIEEQGVVAFQTRGGFRSIGLIDPYPIASYKDAERWKAFMRAGFVEVKRRYDLIADDGCHEVQRMFRAPFVVRDGERQTPELLGDARNLGKWAFECPPPGDQIIRAKARRGGIVTPMDPDALTRDAADSLGRVIEYLDERKVPFVTNPLNPLEIKLTPCIFNPAHDHILITIHLNGAISARCFHSSCNGNKQIWDALKQRLGGWRSLRPNSYLTAVKIIGLDLGRVLDDKKLALDEMAGEVTLGRERLRDTDVSELRARIEQRFIGGKDKHGHAIGISLKSSDVHEAVRQVAARNSFHPVREYLLGLKWDGEKRIDRVVDEILRAARTPLNVALVRNFFIAAAARPLQPGCKVDTVLVLVGDQGALKSTFFKVLASEAFFCDSAIDVHSKDAFLTLRRAWILEWAELESLKRGRDATAIKSFLSIPSDDYRAPYGRHPVKVPRSGVIVGSTNEAEFLTDETGNRRFWPLKVGAIDVGLAAAWRDQLWAEARAAYEASEPWWLAPEEETALTETHREHQVTDPWEERILAWAAAGDGFTTSEAISIGLGKLDEATWTKGDEMRVAKILKRAGYHSEKRHGGIRRWFR